MNKKLIYLLALVFSLGLTFTACSDDDDDTTPDYAKEVAGTYDGELSIPDLLGENKLTNDIILSKNADNKVKMELKSITIPTGETSTLVVTGIEVKSVPISKSNDIYTLAETTEEIKISIKNGELTIPMDAKVKVSGSIKNGKMDLKIYVSEIDIPDLDITFSGTKK